MIDEDCDELLALWSAFLESGVEGSSGDVVLDEDFLFGELIFSMISSRVMLFESSWASSSLLLSIGSR